MNCEFCDKPLIFYKKLRIINHASSIFRCMQADHYSSYVFENNILQKYRLRFQYDENLNHNFIIYFNPIDKETIIERHEKYFVPTFPDTKATITIHRTIKFSFQNKIKLIKKLNSYFNFA